MFCKNENSDKGNWIGKDDQYEKPHSEKPSEIFLYLILTITVCWTLKVLLEGCHRSCSLLNDFGCVLWTDWAFLTDKDAHDCSVFQSHCHHRQNYHLYQHDDPLLKDQIILSFRCCPCIQWSRWHFAFPSDFQKAAWSHKTQKLPHFLPSFLVSLSPTR